MIGITPEEVRRLKLTLNKLRKAVQKLGWRPFTAENIYYKIIPRRLRRKERGIYMRTRPCYLKLVRFLKKMELQGYLKALNYPTKGDPQIWRWVNKRERMMNERFKPIRVKTPGWISKEIAEKMVKTGYWAWAGENEIEYCGAGEG